MLSTENSSKKESEPSYFPLSFAQQRMWFLEELNPEKSIYNLHLSFSLNGPLQINALTNGMKLILERHENLRVSIRNYNGKAYQVIDPTTNVNLIYKDLSNTQREEIEEVIKELLYNESVRPFDLSKAPLFRSILIRLSENRHIFSLTFHHIITDAWSLDLFFNELSEIYNASLEGRDPILPPLEIQYIDFSVWQRKFLSHEIINKQLEYWQKTLKDIPAISSLNPDYDRPSEMTHKGKIYKCKISSSIFKPIIELSHQYNVTLYMILMTIFHILLHRFTNQKTIVIGTPVLNRHYPKTENLIGLFVNTLAIRLDVKKNQTFVDLLLENREKILSANENQDVPFDQILDQIKAERSLNAHPIYQTMFSLKNKVYTQPSFKNLEITPLETDHSTSKFDLNLWGEESDDDLNLFFEYATDLFSENTIEQFASSFEVALEFISRNSTTKIDEIPLISENIREKIMGEWATGKISSRGDISIIDLIDIKAKQVPNKIALKQGEINLTYSQFISKVNKLANFLKAELSLENSRIAVALPRGFDAIIAPLAILKLGCTYVPLDLTWPIARQKYILEDSKIDLILTYNQYQNLFTSLITTLALDSLSPKWQSVDDISLFSPVLPEQTAYIIYTSGSTGQPKGVCIPHRGLANLALSQADLFEINETSKVLQFASLSFDASISEWSTTLSQGGCLCLLIEKAGKLTGDLVQTFKDEAISVVTLPPSVARVLPTELSQTLKTLVLAGEMSSQSLIDRWVNKVKLINAYGPTETTVCATAHIYQKTDKASLIGKPIPNVQVYILNESNQLIPPGITGEIVIGGIGIAKGYLNQDQLTASRFIPDTLKKEKSYGYNLYKTGDLGKYTFDGSIEYIGRIDHQVKLRGYRIELGEIESLLLAHADIEEAIVLIGENKSKQKILAAYLELVPYISHSAYIEKLSNYLKIHLPHYMIPEKWILVDKWPTTSSGKIDRQALLTYESRPVLDNEPRSDIEKTIADIWCKILKIKEVNVHDNFFRIGGDSITAIQFVSKIRKMGFKLSVQQVFKTPTIFDLKQIIQLPSQSNIINIVIDNKPLPLSPIQHWILDQKLYNINHYNQAVILRSRERLSVENIETSLQRVLQTHSSLRLRFEEGVTGEWVQSYKDYEEVEEYKNGVCRVEHLEDLSKEEALRKRLDVIEEVQQSLNITKGPVFQAVLFREKDWENDSLFLVAHHLVIDSVSWRILIEDLEEAYKKAALNEDINLSSEQKSYGWWTQELVRLSQTQAWKEELPYWEEVLEVSQNLLEETTSKTDELINLVEDTEEVMVDLTEEETRQLLQEVPKAYKTQINDILLTALGYAIREWTGKDEVVSFMLEGHGREPLTEEMDLSRTTGWFTSIYPVNIDLKDAEDLSVGIKRVKEHLRAIPRKGMGYGMLRYLTLEGRERLQNKKEPNIVFNYLGQIDASKTKSDLLYLCEDFTESSNNLKNQRQFLVDINACVMNGAFKIIIIYNKKILQKNNINRLKELFIFQLRSIIFNHSSQNLSVAYSSSDFPLCKLEQSLLSHILKQLPPIEDLYPLSPIQSVLLSTVIRAKDFDPYLRQSLFELKGDVKSNLIKDAWQIVVNNEPSLKAGFIWEELETPLQFIPKKIVIEWNEDDWSEMSSIQQTQKVQELLDLDSKNKLILNKPPLLRFYLIRQNRDQYLLVWSIHHILVDGWSTSLIVRKFFLVYEQLLENKELTLSKGRPYKDYIQWLQNQNLEAAEKFWKTYLKEAKLTKLSSRFLSNNTKKYSHHYLELTKEKTRILNQLSTRTQFTLNNIIQAAWAILISSYTQQPDVIFGITVSGRAIDLDQVDEMTGIFINTVPLYVQITPDKPIYNVLKEMQESTLQIQQYSYVSLAKIHSWFGLGGNNLLFDNLFIFENFPIEEKSTQQVGNITIHSSSNLLKNTPTTNEQTEFPLVLGILPQEETILFNIGFDETFFDIDSVLQFLNSLENILDNFIEHVDEF